MTRYDPFSYGQVPIGAKEQQAAAPDDLLFAEAAPVKASPARDSDWAPPADNFGSAFQAPPSADDAMAFGADILGEASPPAAGTAKKAAAAAPARAATKPASPAPTRTVAPAPAAAAAPMPAAKPSPRPAPAPIASPAPLAMPRRSSVAGVLAPLAIVAGGGAAASWLYLIQQNPVMAGIVGLAGLVGGALAWVMMRG